MRNFHYSRPDTLSDALDRLAASEDARPLAGGMTLLPTMKQRLSAPEELVDLSAIGFLTDIDEDDGALVVGAMATHRQVASSALVRERLPGLARLAAVIGDPQVRNRGTIGGSVANNDPAADYPAALLALGATITTDRRDIAADDFFVGLFETALEPGELILSVRFPLDVACAYAKFRHPISGYAMAGAFVARLPDRPRVAITGAAPAVFRAQSWEDALAQDFSADRVRARPIDATGFNADIHASAAYRAQLAMVMTARAVAELGG